MERRVALTDFQKIIVYLAVVTAICGGAMSLGKWSLWPVLTGFVVLAVVVVAAYTIQARRATADIEIVSARVLSVSSLPAKADIKAACTVKLAVRLPGRGIVQTRVRDRAMELRHWPVRGQELLVQVIRGNPHRRLLIRWDLGEQMRARAAADAWENEEPPLVYSPTPRRSASRTSPRSAPAAAGPTPDPQPYLHEVYADPADAEADEPTTEDLTTEDLTTTGADTADFAPAPGRQYADSGHIRRAEEPTEGDGGAAAAEDEIVRTNPQPAARPRPRLEPVALREVDPATVDTRDFDTETPAVTVMPGDDTSPRAGDRGIPQPRHPGTADPTRGGTGIEASLPVADLARSLRFYQQVLGFTVSDRSPAGAVVESGGTRILLESAPTQAGEAGAIHVDVTDIEATCAELRARGVRLLQSPVATAGAGGAQVWRARVRDPDGHDVELVEWRQLR